MKDALGHGSASNGSIGSGIKDRRASFGSYTGPERRIAGDSSNAAAAQALMSGLKSTMVPIHDSMAGSHIDPYSSAARFKGELSTGQLVNRATIRNARYQR
jgi:hypothetical protein